VDWACVDQMTSENNQSRSIEPASSASCRLMYALLFYGSEDVAAQGNREASRNDAVLTVPSPNAEAVWTRLAVELLPTTTAVVLRGFPRPIVLDGPVAATNGELLRIYVISAADLSAAISSAQELMGRPGDTACEIRPLSDIWFGKECAASGESGDV
jgi:hypothetical protein